ncbi:hypothetical protein ACFWCB_35975 [Streptomyces sp. NPDC060048]|uniref:hypothetical protein n=1 Tax=unclassified Streptomyces TaxID=2593676 RepID=UPI0036B9BD4E
MLLEGLRDGFLEQEGDVAGGVQMPEQSGRLKPESCLDLRALVEAVAFEDLVEPFGFGLDAADPGGLPEQRLRRAEIAKRRRLGSKGGRPPTFDKTSYKQRNRAERCINKLKQWPGLPGGPSPWATHISSAR